MVTYGANQRVKSTPYIQEYTSAYLPEYKGYTGHNHVWRH